MDLKDLSPRLEFHFPMAAGHYEACVPAIAGWSLRAWGQAGVFAIIGFLFCSVCLDGCLIGTLVCIMTTVPKTKVTQGKQDAGLDGLNEEGSFTLNEPMVTGC